MELKIYAPQETEFISEIQWNHEEIKNEVAQKVKMYTNIVYTEDQIKEAKADRAKLNKFVKALEDKRKEIKKQCLAPYDDFEKKMKEIIAVVHEPIAIIDKQVKGYEDDKKVKKHEKIKEYWILHAKKIPDITLDMIYDQKWLNASVSMKSIQEEIDNRLEQIKNDMATLSSLPEFGFEAKEVYKTTLDINQAINEAKRMSDIAKAKAEAEKAEKERLEAEAEKKKQEEAAKQELVQQEPTEEAEPITPIGQTIESIERQAYEQCQEEVEPKQWVSFSALLSTEDAVELKEFFNSRNIEFKAI